MASSSGEQLPGQVVLVLQGGGALGAYQVGVYQALHEAGVEPDWVIGTSIGAVNGAIIAGNETEKRLSRLHEFWDKVRLGGWVEPMAGPGRTTGTPTCRRTSAAFPASSCRAPFPGAACTRRSACIPRRGTAPSRCTRRSRRSSTSSC